MPPIILGAGAAVATNLASRAIAGNSGLEKKDVDINAINERLQGLTKPLDQRAQELRSFDPYAAQDYRNQAQFRQKQLGLADLLQNQASGTGNYIADQILKNQKDSNLAQALALQGSLRGNVNTGAAQRMSLQQVGAQNIAANQQAAIQRLQEIQQARDLLANVSQQGRSQDLQSFGQVEQALQGRENLAQNLNQQKQNLLLGQANAIVGQGANLNQQQQIQNQAGKDLGGAISSGISGAAGTAFLSDETKKKDKKDGDTKAKGFLDSLRETFSDKSFKFTKGSAPTPEEFSNAVRKTVSDETKKKDKKDGSEAADSFLEALHSYTYKYKNPEKHGEGTQLGVMAQDLEKTPVGKQMVIDTPEGKMVDYGKGYGAVLAAMSNLHERLKKIED